jgi:hypothetical protein
MKKLMLTAIAAISVAFSTVAQKGFEIGLRAGANLSSVRGEGGGSQEGFWDSGDTRSFGFTGGVYTRIGNKFYVQPEFLVTQKGGKMKDILGVEHDLKQTYFDIPVLVGIKIGNVFRINAGPMATFLVNQDKSFLENIGIRDDEKGFRKALLGYQLGVGFDINKLRLDLRYEGNVNDVFNIDYKDDQTRRQFSGKGNSFSATVGFAF